MRFGRGEMALARTMLNQPHDPVRLDRSCCANGPDEQAAGRDADRNHLRLLGAIPSPWREDRSSRLRDVPGTALPAIRRRHTRVQRDEEPPAQTQRNPSPRPMHATGCREGCSELHDSLATGYVGQALRFRSAHGLRIPRVAIDLGTINRPAPWGWRTRQ